MHSLCVGAVWRLVTSLTNFKANLKIICKPAKRNDNGINCSFKTATIEILKAILR